MKYILLSLLFLMSACATDNTSAGTPRTAYNSPAITPRTVIWTMMSYDDLQIEKKKWGKLDQVLGFSVRIEGQDICYIYTQPPLSGEDSRTLKVVHHELLHCQYGNWHSD